jgi:Flp pilus assembly pilin Flp
MKNLVVRFVREEEGQDLIEYALLASFLSIAAAAGATLAGLELNAWYEALEAKITEMITAIG